MANCVLSLFLFQSRPAVNRLCHLAFSFLIL